MNSVSPFQTEMFIPFHLADPAGILFFGHVFTLVHQAFEQFIILHFCSWEEWFQNKEWIVPIKQTEARYFKPLFAGKICTIALNIASSSTTSFTLDYTISQSNQLCAAGHIVFVFCDAQTKIKRPIPAKFRL